MKCRTVLAKGTYARREITYYGNWGHSHRRTVCPKGCYKAYYEPLGEFWDGGFVTSRQKWKAIREKKEKSKTDPS